MQRSGPLSTQSFDSAHLLPIQSKGLGRCGLLPGSGRQGRYCAALICCQPGTLGRSLVLRGHIGLRAAVHGPFQRLRIVVASVARRRVPFGVCRLFLQWARQAQETSLTPFHRAGVQVSSDNSWACHSSLALSAPHFMPKQAKHSGAHLCCVACALAKLHPAERRWLSLLLWSGRPKPPWILLRLPHTAPETPAVFCGEAHPMSVGNHSQLQMGSMRHCCPHPDETILRLRRGHVLSFRHMPDTTSSQSFCEGAASGKCAGHSQH